MTLPWSARQIEWLTEMGFDVLARRVGDDPAAEDARPTPRTDAPERAAHPEAAADPRPGRDGASAAPAISPMLARAARGVDLAPLLAAHPPRDPASRRALWRALRPLRKAARAR